MKKFIGAVLTVLACTAAYKHYDQLEGKAVQGFNFVKGKFAKKSE